jgi:hypothetical protein
MPETKTKKVTKKRVVKAANTPIPCEPGSTCGHSGCKETCNVRYSGPTTGLRDHHAAVAANGVQHVWTAAIIAGLAVVLTGAIAYSAVQANEPINDLNSTVINQRLDRIERAIKQIQTQNANTVAGAVIPN